MKLDNLQGNFFEDDLSRFRGRIFKGFWEILDFEDFRF